MESLTCAMIFVRAVCLSWTARQAHDESVQVLKKQKGLSLCLGWESNPRNGDQNPVGICMCTEIDTKNFLDKAHGK